MYILRAEAEFDSSHFLSGYDGKCANLHGHRWKIVVEVKSEELIEGGQLDGMVVDFKDLKKDIKAIADEYDHALIIQNDTMRELTLNCLKEDGFKVIEVDFRPTAEKFSYHFYKLMSGKGYDVKRITVYETPTNAATYEV